MQKVEQYKYLCQEIFKDHPSKEEIIDFMLNAFEVGHTDFDRTYKILQEN